MKKEYSPEYPLGFNVNKINPTIEHYMSWSEVAEITRTNIITINSGDEYLIPSEKDAKPLFTYTGNFGNYRSNPTFQGERSPYVGIDIDINEKTSGVNKKAVTESQRKLVNQDIDTLLDILSGYERNYFFCKRTSSGCGLHIVINLIDVPLGLMSAYEKTIFLLFQKALDSSSALLNYEYKVDNSMLALSQGFHLNHDPDVIYNPLVKTSITKYTLSKEHGEGKGIGEASTFSIREGNEVDKVIFIRFAKFCSAQKKRLDYKEIFKLCVIFFQLWPSATEEQFYEICKGLNEERSKVMGSNITFLKNLYKSLKSNLTKEYDGDRLTVNSMYYIISQSGYVYTPEVELHFKGYLSNVETSIFEIFETKHNVLLESPTGSGKTHLLFKYLKQQAILNPRKNFVIALPYTGMVEQFVKEHTDISFKINCLYAGKRNEFVGYTKLPTKNKKKRKKTSTQVVPLFDIQITHNNIWCTTYDSARQIKNIHTLIIDEAHNTVKQYEFREDALDSLDRIECDKRIIITATPDSLLPEVENYFHVRCIKNDAVKPKLSILKIDGTVYEEVKNSIRQTSSSLTFLNDKVICEKIKQDLYVEDINVAMYNRDTKKQEHQIHMQNEGIISDHSIATSYLSEGYNVLNPNIQRINIASNYCIDTIRQSAARPRKCYPEIRLILKETEYDPGTWVFNRAFEYSKMVSRIQAIVTELNSESERLVGDRNENRFTAFEDELRFINSDQYGAYEINSAKIKLEIDTHYYHWLYHKKRELWLAEMRKHFIIGDISLKANETDEIKKEQLPFDVFRNAGDMILLFHQYNIDKKKSKKLKYTPDMKLWSDEHNRIQLTEGWKRWTTRYLKMMEYNDVDFDTIQSGLKFNYWQRKNDFTVSVKDTPHTAKETLISNYNKVIVDFLLKMNLSSGKLTTSDIFTQLNAHLKKQKLKKLQKQKQFFASITGVLTLSEKQVRGTGIRYIDQITIQKELTPHLAMLEKQRQQDKMSDERFESIAD